MHLETLGVGVLYNFPAGLLPLGVLPLLSLRFYAPDAMHSGMSVIHLPDGKAWLLGKDNVFGAM